MMIVLHRCIQELLRVGRSVQCFMAQSVVAGRPMNARALQCWRTFSQYRLATFSQYMYWRGNDVPAHILWIFRYPQNISCFERVHEGLGMGAMFEAVEGYSEDGLNQIGQG